MAVEVTVVADVAAVADAAVVAAVADAEVVADVAAARKRPRSAGEGCA